MIDVSPHTAEIYCRNKMLLNKIRTRLVFFGVDVFAGGEEAGTLKDFWDFFLFFFEIWFRGGLRGFVLRGILFIIIYGNSGLWERLRIVGFSASFGSWGRLRNCFNTVLCSLSP